MNILESVRVALEGIAASKLRSVLTTLGIVIGIAAVIAVVAIGQGGRAILMAELEKVGTNIFAVFVDWRKNEVSTGREFSLNDVDIIKSRVPEITHLSPVNNTSADVRGTRKNIVVQVLGVNADMAVIRKLNLKSGHFFSRDDDLGRRRVAVVDEALAADLFGRTEPLGQKVVINNTPFIVVGVIAKGDSLLGFGENPKIYIPVQVWTYVFSNYVGYLEGSTASREQVTAAMNQAIKVLERRHQQPGLYQGQSMEQQMQSANKITGVMTLII
ncbi:MAG: ABC transporter permease, partial [Actinobacteria bacterium]|nr:ABC transporter permease [Actinomycetota bacterium]